MVSIRNVKIFTVWKIAGYILHISSSKTVSESKNASAQKIKHKNVEMIHREVCMSAIAKPFKIHLECFENK